MNRREMIQKLNQLQYATLWPEYSWMDIGFTEREIWINKSGYGYFACDEPNNNYKVKISPTEVWIVIMEKAKEGILSKDDLKDTTFSQTIFYSDYDWQFYKKQLENILLVLPKNAEYFYCGETINGIEFFSNENDFYQYFKHEDVDTNWGELKTEMLGIWIKRLFHNDIQAYTGYYELIE